MPNRYRNKQEVEAVQWMGENREEVEALIGSKVRIECGLLHADGGSIFLVEGDYLVCHGDESRESVAAGLFEATYEPVGQGERGAEGLTPERIKQIEFDAWLSFRPEFAEALTAFRDAFNTDTSAAAGDDPDSEFRRSVAQSAFDKGKGGGDG